MKLIAVLRAAFRGTQFVLHLSLGVILGSGYRLRYGAQWHLTPAGQSIIHWWMQHVTRIVDIHITQYGTPLKSNVMLVSNHISFLDIVVISAIVPVRFLAKDSVRYWPIIGYLTSLSGSLFIQRGKRQQITSTIEDIGSALQNGRPLVIFPEGTTSIGMQVLKFHTGLFQAAVDHAIPVQPITLHYRRHNTADRIAAYIDQDNFLLTLLRLMAQDNTEVHVIFSAPLLAGEQSRQILAAQCHARISQALQSHLPSPLTEQQIDERREFAILGECER